MQHSFLEWRTKVYLAQDKIGMREIANGEDLHSDNQEHFKLPSRLIAKIFIYRMIFADAFGEQRFRGPAFAYANDPDFMQVSSSPKYWEKVIERFFDKYQDIYNHSVNLIREATSTGRIVSPSGRFYNYGPTKIRKGVPDWPRSEILNHIVQGLSADFMQCGRLELRYRLKKLWEVYTYKRILLINTVHDDIELDVDNDAEIVYNSCVVLEDVFKDIPRKFERLYGVVLNVPMAGECKFGMNMSEKSMVKFDRNSFTKQWSEYYGECH